ncbi:MAG TPA: sugar-binding domain-containing protein, partial [Gemmatimonadales bacterium]
MALTLRLSHVALLAVLGLGARPDSIPLPEHPRPDFQRDLWLNLNGRWRFAFDPEDSGERAGWPGAGLPGAREIVVPFSWGSPLSGVPDSGGGDIGWYERTLTVPETWTGGGRRVFIVFGASDWRTTAWLDGTKLGEYQGGYTPFSFELTPHLRPGRAQRLVVRVDDAPHPFKLEGKQGYGKARGLWQTVYVEARGTAPLASVHFTPRRDLAGVGVDVRLLEPAPRALTLAVTFTNRDGRPTVTQRIAAGARTTHLDVPLPGARRWSLDDPFLHEVVVSVAGPGSGFFPDSVRTYFGMRTIGVADVPGTTIPYVAINGTPVYLQLTLDQAYHPEGYYTFPTDSALREEVLRPRRIGLNGLREHVKIETPRKLYWADRLGVLIMADVPNWWGPPDSAAFREHEVALRGMIERDYNHPAVFAWVLFNETWGLETRVGNESRYLPEAQARVVRDYRLARSLDSTRLVEDNSPCCGRGHTETDLNSWHAYLPGWEWEAQVSRISDSTGQGSTWNFERGWRQARQPMLNSEFGNVWGYDGSTGDVDWSWDYRRAIDAFRRHPKLAGWLYTEHHDVINEWNGYWRADRSWKETGLGGIVDGMSLRDLHAPLYLAVGDPALARAARPGERVEVPLYASFLSGSTAFGDSLTIRAELSGWNTLGEERTWSTYEMRIPYRPWMSLALAPLSVTMPREPALAVLAVRLTDGSGTVLQRSFTAFVVQGDAPDSAVLADGNPVRVSRVAAGAVADARWSLKHWTVLDGRKVDGAGSGYFEYHIPWPAGLDVGDVAAATFLVEASAKRLNGKDRDSTVAAGGDYMRGGGFHDRSANRNSYPMTSGAPYPSAVTVRVNGTLAGAVELADDPADSRGILSWYAQPRDGHLYEAGSYGQLVRVAIPRAALVAAARTGQVVVRLEVGEALPGGLAIYGAQFGRYPVDPTVLFVLRGRGGTAAGAQPHVTRAPFGRLPDGRAVEQFTLTNLHGVEVRAITYGAVITAVRTPDRDGKLDDVVLGFDSLEPYLGQSPYFGAIVGRYANRIAQGRFQLDGRSYRLARNNGPNSLHGGLRGFDKVLWTGEPFEGDSGAGVVFRYTSPDGEEGYPGTLQVRVTYRLTPADELVVEYEAQTERATPVNLSQHTYWNLHGAGRGTILDHVLTLDASAFTPVDSTLIPTGAITPVAGTPFDFRTPTAIGARIAQPDVQLRFG